MVEKGLKMSQKIKNNISPLNLDVRKDFPILSQKVHGKEVCYLDSAASAQKPKFVIEAMNKIMLEYYSNVHRGVHTFGSKTTIAYENARSKVANFLNAKTDREIIFTRNATAAINLIASVFGQSLKEGDEVIISELEHHANIVPWYFLKEQRGVVLKVIPIKEDRSLDMAEFEKLLSKKTKMVAITQMSNVLGTITPIKEIVEKAHAVGAKVLVDGSQGVVHLDVDVQNLDCDFYVFTGHKLYAPTGIGVLYGKMEELEKLPPYQGGGEMIEEVFFDNITYKEPPYRFEAGTPPIIEAIGLAAAIDYLSSLDMVALRNNEAYLVEETEKRFADIDGLEVFSNSPNHAAIVSFAIDKIHPHDIATVFDQLGIAVRAGHHCAQPLIRKLGVTATLRASFAIYNKIEDVERLVQAVEKVKKIFL